MIQLQTMSNIDLINQLFAANTKYLAATRNYYPADKRTQEHTDAHKQLKDIISEIERRKANGVFVN